MQLGVNKSTVDTIAAQLQSDSRALRHDLKLHDFFRRKALAFTPPEKEESPDKVIR